MIDAPLADNEREMLEKLMAAVRARFGDLLIEARLFGSKARGDSDPESDIDVWLLFERELTREEQDWLLDLSMRLDLEYRTVTTTMARPRWLWEETGYKHTDFALALQEEGVPI